MIKKVRFAWILVGLVCFAFGAQAAPAKTKPAKRSVEVSSLSTARKLDTTGDQGQSSVLFGGPAASTLLLQGTLGFSNLPRLGVHYGIGDLFSIGGVFAFDLTYYGVTTLLPNIQFLIPMNLTFSRGALVAGLRLEPGFALGFAAGTAFPNLIIDLESNIGGRIGDVVKLGGGLDVPFAVTFLPTAAVVTVPLLFGPAVEVNPISDLGIHADLKFGPVIYAGPAGAAVNFGMRLGFGIHYAL